MRCPRRRSGPLRPGAARAHGCRRHRRRHHRGLHGAVPRREGHAVALCEKGGSAANSRAATGAGAARWGATSREIPLAIESSAAVARHEPRVGRGDRISPGRHRLSVRDRGSSATARGLAEHGAAVSGSMRACCAARRIGAAGAGRSRRASWAALYTPSDGRAEPRRRRRPSPRRRGAGATILTECAVRGVETRAGGSAASVTERGRIACDAVVLAGGAWSRLFCGNLGRGLAAAEGARLGAAHGATGRRRRRSAVGGATSRSASGSTAATRSRRRGATMADITPDSFRLLLRFPAGLRTQWHELRLRVGRRFFGEWRTPRRWPLDAASPFERVRVLDPAPTRPFWTRRGATRARLPGLRRHAGGGDDGAGMIDVTPDAVPVISPVRRGAGLLHRQRLLRATASASGRAPDG